MNKKINLIWIIGLLVLSSFVSAYYCYQESVNTTNQTGIDGNCSLNYGGSYNPLIGSGVNITAHNLEYRYMIDGNYSSAYSLFYSSLPNNFVISNISIVKPLSANNLTVTILTYMTSLTGTYVNITVPSSCFRYLDTSVRLFIKQYQDPNPLYSVAGVFCSDGSIEDSFGARNMLWSQGSNTNAFISSTLGFTHFDYNVGASGFYDVIYDKYYYWGMNPILNVTAFNVTGSAISHFNFTINGTTYSTTTGSLVVPIYEGYSYSSSIDAPGYSFGYYNFVANSSANQFKAFTLNVSNAINISIFNELTNVLIAEPINITVTDITKGIISYANTSTGKITLLNITPFDNIELKFSSINYSDKVYYVSILNKTYNTLYAYLIPKAASQNFSICWYDYSGAIVSNLHIYQYYLSSGGYILSQDVFTDINGKSIFAFNPSGYYLYNYSSSAGSQSFSVVPFVLNPPQNTVFLADGCNYDVTLKSATSSINYTILNITGHHTFNNNTKILNFSYISTELGLTYEYLVYNKGSKVCNGTSLLLSNSFNCNLTSYEGTAYIYGLANNNIFYSSTQDLNDLKLSDFVSIEEASFLSGIIFLIVLVAGASLGVIVSVIFSVVALIIIMWLGIFSGLSIGIVAIASIIGIIIGVIIRRYR